MIATDERTISVHVNGEALTVPATATVASVLQLAGRDPAMPGVAVAVNDHVRRRAEWETAPLADGDRVEIVIASQGG